MIDPDGQFEDWFQNEITGDVYYNPVMKKGDESQLGENWAHMGENGMFGSNDQLIVKSNSDIAQVGSIEVSVSDPNSGNETGKAPMHTSLFKGDNAKSFMSEQGYDFKPVLFKYHSDITTEYHPEPHGQLTMTYDNSSIESVMASKYIHRHMVLKNTEIIGKYKESEYGSPKYYGPMYSIRKQSWTYRKNNYVTHALGRKAGKAINWLKDNTPWKSGYEDMWEKIIK